MIFLSVCAHIGDYFMQKQKQKQKKQPCLVQTTKGIVIKLCSSVLISDENRQYFENS